VRKLRETRVLVGMSRIKPKSERTDPGVQKLSKEPIDWLPAIDIRGEGIFIEFRSEQIMEWSKRADRRIRAASEACGRAR
jgi:hypothetical protein